MKYELPSTELIVIEENNYLKFGEYLNDMQCDDTANKLSLDDLEYVKKLQQENKQLKEQLEYLRSGEYYNQLGFENQMLQQVVDTNGVPSEVYDYIDCTHRNTELLKENKQLKDLIDTILNFSFFKEECPLNFGFENNTNEDKSQSIFYEDEWCENNCNDNYKDCWLKYFKKLQELEKGSDE